MRIFEFPANIAPVGTVKRERAEQTVVSADSVQLLLHWPLLHDQDPRSSPIPRNTTITPNIPNLLSSSLPYQV